MVGLGHGRWLDSQASAQGYDQWIEADVSLAGLGSVTGRLDAVAHCASNGSVPQSLAQPLEAFDRTVASTAALLEHLRLHAPEAVVFGVPVRIVLDHGFGHVEVDARADGAVQSAAAR